MFDNVDVMFDESTIFWKNLHSNNYVVDFVLVFSQSVTNDTVLYGTEGVSSIDLGLVYPEQ